MKTHLAGAKSLRPVPCVLSVTKCSDCQVSPVTAGLPSLDAGSSSFLAAPLGPSPLFHPVFLLLSSPRSRRPGFQSCSLSLSVPGPGPASSSGLSSAVVLRLLIQAPAAVAQKGVFIWVLGPLTEAWRGLRLPPPPPEVSPASDLHLPCAFLPFPCSVFQGSASAPSCAGSSLREAVGARSGGLAVPDVTAAQGHRPLGTGPAGGLALGRVLLSVRTDCVSDPRHVATSPR